MTIAFPEEDCKKNFNQVFNTVWSSDERVLPPCFNAWYFCSYELLCRRVECIFLRCPNLESW